MDFCRFEIEEIQNAALKDGEEEKVAADFKRFSNARRIAESLSQAYDAVSGDAMSRAFREIDGAMAFDEGLKGIRDELWRCRFPSFGSFQGDRRIYGRYDL